MKGTAIILLTLGVLAASEVRVPEVLFPIIFPEVAQPEPAQPDAAQPLLPIVFPEAAPPEAAQPEAGQPLLPIVFPEAAQPETAQPANPEEVEQPEWIEEIGIENFKPIVVGPPEKPEVPQWVEPSVVEPASVTFLPNGCPASPHVHWLLPHKFSCRRFYYCVNGQKVLRSCPSNLHFNKELQVCDWPQDAGCRN